MHHIENITRIMFWEAFTYLILSWHWLQWQDGSENEGISAVLGSCQQHSSLVRAGTVGIPGEESVTESLGEASLLLRNNKREKNLSRFHFCIVRVVLGASSASVTKYWPWGCFSDNKGQTNTWALRKALIKPRTLWEMQEWCEGAS